MTDGQRPSCAIKCYVREVLTSLKETWFFILQVKVKNSRSKGFIKLTEIILKPIMVIHTYLKSSREFAQRP
jgi:hypothetical protein